MKKTWFRIVQLGIAVFLSLPGLAMAAAEKAAPIIIVADKRLVEWGPSVYFLNLYNTDPFMFGLVCALITTFLGVSFGLVTDQIMKHTGIDLTSRKIIEH
ncbi:MAG: DVU0150 family protein [Pseudomonadota bacterium]